MLDPKTCVELRVLGPEGKPYVDLKNEYSELFKKHEAYFVVPWLFSAPPKTSVAIVIGVGVITGSATYLVEKFIDKVFSINENQPNTEITINVYNGNDYISVDGDKSEIVRQLKEFKESDPK